jgi:multiple sugar transport system permease protein
VAETLIAPRATSAPVPPEQPTRPRGRRRLSLAATAWWVVCIVLASMFLLPLVTMLLASFKSRAELGQTPPTLLPREFTIDNWVRLFDPSDGAVTGLGNSAVVSIGAVVLTVILSTLAGYGFGRHRFRGDNLLFVVILAGMMVPFTVLLPSLLLVLRALSLNNTLLGVVLVYTMYQLPFCVFIMRNSFAGIPDDIEEAALLDGCSRVGVLRRIFIPLVIPGIVTSAIFTFLAAWNEFLGALVLLSDQSSFTLPIVLRTMQIGQFGTVDWGILNAGIVVSMIPCLAIFFLLQRYYVDGIFAGAAR